MMFKFGLIAIFSILAWGAQAADLAVNPQFPAWRWTGFYAGLNGGYGSAGGSSTVTVTGGALGDSTGSSTGSGINGGIAGGQIGYNFQTGSLVFGVEADYQWTGQSKFDDSSCGSGCDLVEKTSLTSFGTLRGRIGAAFDRTLFYGTAGFAYMTGKDTVTGNVDGLSATLIDLPLSGVGWTAGAGLEVMATDRWSVKAEYLYLQSTSATGSAALPAFFGGNITENVRLHDHIVRAGLNYRF
jgi:outer membrane immunogenic protein